MGHLMDMVENTPQSKFRIVIKCVLVALILMIFPVLSGTIVGIVNAVTGLDIQIKGQFIQALFMLFSVLVSLIILRKQKLTIYDIGFTFKITKACLYFLPCVIIYIPVLFNEYQKRSFSFVIVAIALYLLVGIAEEIYFRGIIPNILQKGFGKYQVIIISSVIFGISHCAAGLSGIGITEIILTILNAVIFGWLAIELKYLTNNITILMAIHFLFDLETKFISDNSPNLIFTFVIRGTLMSLYAIILLVLITKDKKKVRNNF